MSNDLMNISAFKGIQPANAFKVLDPHAESLADGIGSSYGIVGYKGKVWSLRLRGESYMFVRPDDGSPAAFLDVIVLRAPAYKSKSYYPAGTFQDGQLGARPTCAALNGETPDMDIMEPQNNACATCPRNVFKLNAEGRKTRECSDYKRLAVLILPTMTKALLGAPLMEPVFLRVPAASLNDLALLGEGMSAQGFHFSSYVTRIGFNPEKPHPQMTFRALQPLTDNEAPLVLPMREDPTAIRITGENELARLRPALASAAPVQAAPAVTLPAVAAQAPVDTGFGVAAVTAQPAQAPAAVVQTAVAAQTTTQQVEGPVDTGFGAGVQANTAATMNTVADTGEPEDADADLDARIAALLPK